MEDMEINMENMEGHVGNLWPSFQKHCIPNNKLET